MSSLPVRSPYEVVRMLPGVIQEDRAAVIADPAVVAFQRRDPTAVRVFFRRYGRLVYGVAYRVLGRADLAEEAAQQTFVRAWQAADRLDPDRDPARWLATIAKRVAIDIHRRESRSRATSLDVVAADHPSLVTSPVDIGRLDAAWRVRQAIDTLPPNEAVVVRMQHLEGLMHREIAAELGVALGTVKSRSTRAHGKLARALRHLREPLP